MLDRSITSLAILKVNWDERHIDYIENFVPFFSNLIKIKQYKEIDVNSLKHDFRREYGLSIPSHPIMAILNRLKKRKMVYQADGKFIPRYTEIKDSNFDIVSADQHRKLNKLIDAIIDFSNVKYSSLLNRDEAEKALLGFLKENELSLLFATDEKNILPDTEINRTNKFLIAKFVQTAKDSDPEIFQFILDIAIGSALAATIVYGSDLAEHLSGRMKNLNFYLDAGYIFSLLGVDGKENREAFEELTQTLIDDGARIFIFEHTYDEIMRIFNSALHRMSSYEPEKASRTLRYFITNEFTETDVEMFISNVPTILERFKIQKAPRPNYADDIIYQIDEIELKKLIVDAYRTDPLFDENQKDETINKDIESIYSICKLRKGNIAFTLKDASHVFITTNKLLARLSRRVQTSDNISFSIPPCLTDVFIGTVLWLQNPIKTTELNEKKIIANAYAAIQPDSRLIKRYLDQIEVLKKNHNISENQYYVLRSHRVAFNLLSETTKNDSNNFGSITTTQILDEINKKHLSDLKQEVEYHKKLSAETKESLKRSERLLQQKYEQEKILSGRYKKLLNFSARAIMWIILPIVLAVIIYFLIVISFPSFTNRVAERVIAFIVIAIITLSGFNIPSFKDWLLEKIRSSISKIIS